MSESILDKWVQDPVTNLNLLNTLIPNLITQATNASKTSSFKKVVFAVETIRETLEDKKIITQAHYSDLLTPKDSDQSTNSVSAAQKFIKERLSVLLSKLADSANPQTIKLVIRLIMPYVFGALEYLQESEEGDEETLVKWL